jgi:hypothetical protein
MIRRRGDLAKVILKIESMLVVAFRQRYGMDPRVVKFTRLNATRRNLREPEEEGTREEKWSA